MQKDLQSSVLAPATQMPVAPAKRVFVTGGTGLVGSHLLHQLAKTGNHIIALHRGKVPGALRMENIYWVEGDILDVVALQDTMAGAEQVYHCAAMVSFKPAQRSMLFKINVEGTANVVNAALITGVKKMLFVSSVAALGRIRQGELIDETMNWTKETSNSEYGKSKYLAELEVWRGIGEGLQAAIINPSIILGAADWNKGSAGIFRSAYNEFPWYTNGKGGFVDVLDVVKIMMWLMDSNVSGQRYVVNAENRTYREIFTLAAQGFGKKPPHKNVTPLLAAIIWRLEAVKSAINGSNPLLTKETVHTALTTALFDNRKLLSHMTGFRYTPIEQTIQRVCAEIEKVPA